MTDPRPRGRPRKARLEGAEAALSHPDPVPGNNGEALERIVHYFKAEFPDEWDVLCLCPLQHGIDTMVERLK